jgi:hypothetical protein
MPGLSFLLLYEGEHTRSSQQGQLACTGSVLCSVSQVLCNSCLLSNLILFLIEAGVNQGD